MLLRYCWNQWLLLKGDYIMMDQEVYEVLNFLISMMRSSRVFLKLSSQLVGGFLLMLRRGIVGWKFGRMIMRMNFELRLLGILLWGGFDWRLMIHVIVSAVKAWTGQDQQNDHHELRIPRRAHLMRRSRGDSLKQADFSIQWYRNSLRWRGEILWWFYHILLVLWERVISAFISDCCCCCEELYIPHVFVLEKHHLTSAVHRKPFFCAQLIPSSRLVRIFEPMDECL